METPDRPFPRSYWVQPHQLLAGRYPGDVDPKETDERLNALLDAGIRGVINLTEGHEPTAYGLPFRSYAERLKELADERGVPVRVLSYPILDMSVPSDAEMTDILDAIDASLGRTEPVYVHCWGGYGRTGTVIGCWLARHGVATGTDVLDALRERRAGLSGDSPQTAEQCDMITRWPQEKQ